MLIRIAGLFLVFMVAFGTARAEETAPDFADFDHTALTPRSGAPSNVYALAQTGDGLLWVGSAQGLYRFDGVRFLPWRGDAGHPLADTTVTALLALPGGEVWVGTRFGHVYGIRGTEHVDYGEAQGLPVHTVNQLATDGAGRIWAGTGEGAFVLRGSRWEEVRARDGATLRVISYSSMKRDREGRLWALSADRGVYCLEPGATVFEKRRKATELNGVLISDPAGDVWISDEDGLISLSVPGRNWPISEMKNLDASHTANTMLRFLDREGVLWGQNFGGLLRLPCPPCGGAPGPLQRWPRDQELSGNEVLAVLQDREGNVWVGTSGGLDRFHRNKFDRVTFNGSAVGNVALAAGSQDLTIGTYTMGLFRRDPAGHVAPHPAGTPGDGFVLMLYMARDGALWVGGTSHLFRLGARGYEAMPLQGVEPGYFAQAMAEDRAGGLWFSAAHAGVYRLQDGRWTRNGGLQGLPPGPALAMQSDDGQGLWFGYPNDKLAIVQGEEVRLLGQTDGLDVGNVLAFLPDGRGMLVAGTTGVARVDGTRIVPLLDRDGQAFAGVSGLVRDRNGDLWLNGSSGVSHVTRAELAAFAAQPGRRVSVENFGVRAGVSGAPETLGPMPTAAATSDGRLWFSTSSGLFSIDPGRIRRNLVAPVVQILSVGAGDHALPAAASVKLPAAIHSLEVDYTAASLSAPELVRFRYRLDGVDTDWQDAQGRRQAFYTNVPPGSYVFHVTAINEDGVESATEQSMTIVVPAAFWQTGWFKAVCIALAAVFAWTAFRIRTEVLARRLCDRYEERMRERERIARELHDTLLQGTQGLVLEFQVIANKLPPDDARRHEMEAILDRADEAIAQARDRVYELRSQADGDVDFATALAAVAADFDIDKKARLEMAVDHSLPPLRPPVSSELLCIAREALINAFRHAQATTIRLALTRERRGLRLSIRDDGVGMTPELLVQGRPGHFGLTGMRERAKRLGATLELHSELGQGTEVTLRLRARLAFEPGGRELSFVGDFWRSWFGGPFPS